MAFVGAVILLFTWLAIDHHASRVENSEEDRLDHLPPRAE